MWKRMRHPNVVPFIGITQNPLQFVSEWMPNGTLTEYVNQYPSANRIGLVSLTPGIAAEMMTLFASVIRRCRRASISSCKAHHAWRFERGKCLLQAALIPLNNLRLVRYSYRPRRSRPFDRFWFRLSCSWATLCRPHPGTGIHCEVGRARSYSNR